MADDGITAYQGKQIIALLESILATTERLERDITEISREVYKARCSADEIAAKS
jgi:hypothetical protein